MWVALDLRVLASLAGSQQLVPRLARRAQDHSTTRMVAWHMHMHLHLGGGEVILVYEEIV